MVIDIVCVLFFFFKWRLQYYLHIIVIFFNLTLATWCSFPSLFVHPVQTVLCPMLIGWIQAQTSYHLNWFVSSLISYTLSQANRTLAQCMNMYILQSYIFFNSKFPNFYPVPSLQWRFAEKNLQHSRGSSKQSFSSPSLDPVPPNIMLSSFCDLVPAHLSARSRLSLFFDIWLAVPHKYQPPNISFSYFLHLVKF